MQAWVQTLSLSVRVRVRAFVRGGVRVRVRVRVCVCGCVSACACAHVTCILSEGHDTADTAIVNVCCAIGCADEAIAEASRAGPSRSTKEATNGIA